MKYYVVEALRYGDRERHSYVVGVYTTIEQAARNGLAHEYWRGGKYFCVITEHEPDIDRTEEIEMTQSEVFTGLEYEEAIAGRIQEYEESGK